MKSPHDNAIDPLGHLGHAIKPEPAKPASTPTSTPGILRQPDGRLETQIPVGSQPRVFPA